MEEPRWPRPEVGEPRRPHRLHDLSLGLRLRRRLRDIAKRASPPPRQKPQSPELLIFMLSVLGLELLAMLK